MRIIFVFAVFALVSISGAQAERILCAPEKQISIAKGKWEAEYSGSLSQIIVSRQFTPSGPNGTVIFCMRSVGAMKMWSSKSCRLIAGDQGSSQPWGSGKYEDGTMCEFKPFSLIYSNDTSCMIECY